MNPHAEQGLKAHREALARAEGRAGAPTVTADAIATLRQRLAEAEGKGDVRALLLQLANQLAPDALMELAQMAGDNRLEPEDRREAALAILARALPVPKEPAVTVDQSVRVILHPSLDLSGRFGSFQEPRREPLTLNADADAKPEHKP